MGFYGGFAAGVFVGTALGILVAHLLIELGKYIATKREIGDEAMSHKFEEDLQQLSSRIANDLDFATDVYNALCNMRWQRKDNQKEIYSCSWRYAGGLVADMRGNNDSMNYMDFYCSGNEGVITDEVAAAFEKLGWVQLPWNDVDII